MATARVKIYRISINTSDNRIYEIVTVNPEILGTWLNGLFEVYPELNNRVIAANINVWDK
jgi:hypothetical protein